MAAADLGTGTWTALTQIAADALGAHRRTSTGIGDTAFREALVRRRLVGMIRLGHGHLEAAARCASSTAATRYHRRESR